MMYVSVICIGKLKEKYLKDAVLEYSQRLSRFCRLEIIEIPDEKIPDNAGEKLEEQIKEREGRLIIAKLKSGTRVFAMCIEGALVSSEDIACEVESAAMQGAGIAFVIGGSLGLSDEVKSRADKRISFGRITLPHQLMRAVMCEQIYRAFKIINNENYHK